eukprot:g3599.t1
MNNVEGLRTNSHPFWPVNWPPPRPVEPIFIESQNPYNRLRIDVKQTNEVDVYRALDEVAFSPSMGVCTPSPRNMAVFNRPNPFSTSKEVFGRNMSEQELCFHKTQHVSMRNIADSLSFPSMEFSDQTNSTYSNESTSPELRLEQQYQHQNAFQSGYKSFPAVWSCSYPPGGLSPDWQCNYQPFYKANEVQRKWTMDNHSQRQGVHSCNSRLRFDRRRFAVASKRYESPQGKTNASDKSWQCHPDVGADGRLKLNARQRRTLKRAEGRVLQALGEAVAALSSSA